MGSRTYRATGVFLRAMEGLLDLDLRVTGAENLTDRPTLFVVNHFTRFETMIIPYVAYRYIPKQVRNLADHGLFKGVLGRYLRSCGVMSVREPLRNRTIIGDLMTGRYNWAIYPEGLMMKNKKIVSNGRLKLNCPSCHDAPHTGAAVLALKTVIYKRQYLDAAAAGDAEMVKHYQSRYGFESPDQIAPTGTVMVPINITYYPLRPDKNILNRLAKLINPDLSARADEELQVEGKILLEDSDMSIHFGTPIEVADYLDKPTAVLRRLAGLVSPHWQTDLLLTRQAKRLTRDAMRSIYSNTEINFDHLFCYAVCALRQDTIGVEAMRRVLYLSALELRQRGDVRLHPHLISGLSPLTTGDRFEPLDSIVALARDDGVLTEADGQYRIDHAALQDPHDFHAIRLRNMVQVIANELEPVGPAVAILRRNMTMPEHKLKKELSKAVWQADRHLFHRDYDQWCTSDQCKPAQIGEPFFLEAPDATLGVVLAHGYLSAPQEIRALAQYLHDHLGVSVYGVRLKGHGTNPEALTKVTWRDWIGSMRRGYAAVKHHCDHVVFGGFSLGGVLALYMAAKQKDAISGVFSINGPIKLRDKRAVMVPAVMWLNRFARAMGISQGVYEKIDNTHTENPDIN